MVLHKRWGGLVGVLTSLVVVSPAQGRTVAVNSHAEDPGFMVVMPDSCDVNRTGVCSIGGDGSATFTGDLTGFSEYHTSFTFDPLNFGGTGRVQETYYGTVAGCGVGSVHWEVVIPLKFSEFDPATQSFPVKGTWQIYPGSGTGDLEDATGGGTVDARLNPFTRENHGTLAGSVTCHSEDH